ncbi:hypothetical protein WJX72_000692 [[Myrmecia] bisecta]|uniref:Protein kinase domain-containing protein n=1 Tax=[Myrmecia] bisecta TaxID=41462 RepID=A0AAW1PXH5_9CHLO
MKAVNGMMSQRINQSFMDYSDSAADLVLLADSFSSHASAAHEWQDGRSSAASGASGDEPQQPAGRSKSFSSGKLQHLGSADEDSIPAVHRSSKSMTISGRPPLKGSIHRQRSTAAGELSHAGSGRFGSALQSARKSIAAAPSLGLASPKEAPGRQTMGLLPSLQPVRHILTPDNVEETGSRLQRTTTTAQVLLLDVPLEHILRAESPTEAGSAAANEANSLSGCQADGDQGWAARNAGGLASCLSTRSSVRWQLDDADSADDGGEAGAMPEGREGALCTYDKTRWRRLEDFAALSTIADGRNTHVYLGVTKDAKQATVAIKAYYKAHMGPGAGRHLALERELLRTLRHPHIVQGFGEFEDEAANYLVQEFAEGDNLLHYIRHHQSLARREGLSHTACMPEQEIAVRIAAPLLDALALLHSRGIVHCDLKPENLVFQRGVLKVIDLGLAIDVAVDKLHCKVGTLHYLSPEVIAANPPQGAAATKLDIWGLGIVVWELLTGRTPFYHESRNITMSLITEAKLPLDDLTRLHVSSQCKDFLTPALNEEVINILKA